MMNELEGIERRVEKLEQSARRWRLFAVAVVACGVVVIGGAADEAAAVRDGAFRVVTCRELHVFDDKGKTQIVLTDEGVGAFNKKVTINSPTDGKAAATLGLIDDRENTGGWFGMLMTFGSDGEAGSFSHLNPKR